MNTHMKLVCKCGKVILECKCSTPKEVIVTDKPCRHEKNGTKK